MNWNQNKLGYYADFALVPALMFAALWFFYHGRIGALAAGIVAGFVAWTFLEYWIHRSLFHRVFRTGHGLHHCKPRGFVAAPVWLTGLAHVAIMAAFTRFDSAAVLGAFLGLEAGYMAYIVLHDRIHHTARRPTGWLLRKWELHMMHHHGLEKNFGVTTTAWDRVFRTYWGPRWQRVGGVDAR